MKLAFILAMDEKNGIGYQNQLPWHLPEDLKHFKEITLGKPVLMGRKTYISIGRPLPGRKNVIITRDQNFTAPGCEVYHSPSVALSTLQDFDEVMVIGGADLFKQLMSQADRIYLTRIHATFVADVYFTAWDEKNWHIITAEEHQIDKKNPYSYTFITYER